MFKNKNKKTKINNQRKIIFPRFGLKKQVDYFLQGLAELLSAGVSLSSALEVIQEETQSKRMKKILTEINEEIKNGVSLSDALDKKNILSKHTLSFIRLGEISGNLPENLKVIVLQNEKEVVFKSRMNSALMYPVIIFFITIIMGVGTAWYVLPKIADAYAQMGSELPFLTKVIIALGTFFADYGYIIIPFFILSILLAFYFLFSFPKTKFIGHLILFHIPIVKGFIREVETARFGYLFGTMIKAGLSISECLDALPNSTTFNNYKKLYRHLGEQIKEGKSFKESINSYPKSRKLLPAGARQIILTAEKSGGLGEAFLRIGKMYEARTETIAKNLPIILEPILLLLIGFGVLLFVLGTMAPIYNLTDII